MSIAASYPIEELALDLRELYRASVANKSELAKWYAKAKQVQDKILADANLVNSIPHFVWHYLSDADIRMKDPAYAQVQNARMLEIIEVIEKGNMPSGNP